MQFSDQAALNIVLKDNVKNAWTGILDVGMGSAIQQGTDYLYSGRLMGMVFGRKRQNLSMYKCDNTGKDISKKLTDTDVYSSYRLRPREVMLEFTLEL